MSLSFFAIGRHRPIGEHQAQCPWSLVGSAPPPGSGISVTCPRSRRQPGPAGAHARLPWAVASEAKVPFQDPRPRNSFLSHHLPSLACQQHSRFGISNFILKSLHFMYLNLSLNCISPDCWQELDSSLEMFYFENTLVHLKFISL